MAKRKAAAGTAGKGKGGKKNQSVEQKELAPGAAAPVGSTNELEAPGNDAGAEAGATPAGAKGNMELTLKQKPGARKSDRLVIFDYTDRKGSVQFLRTAFGETVPETITISGDFAPPAAPKVKETKEERKARLAAETPADKIARAEARVAKLREKLAKAEAATPVA